MQNNYFKKLHGSCMKFPLGRINAWELVASIATLFFPIGKLCSKSHIEKLNTSSSNFAKISQSDTYGLRFTLSGNLFTYQCVKPMKFNLSSNLEMKNQMQYFCIKEPIFIDYARRKIYKAS